MIAPGAPSEPAAVGVEALELFVEVLSYDEHGTGFYDRLCEAVCRLARMRRAIIFRYDEARRRVRAAGAHGLRLEQFADVLVTVESAPIAAQALRSDRVVEIVGDVVAQFPPEFAGLFPEPVRLVCAPMVAAGRDVGVILADRLVSASELDAAERYLLWTLGKAAAMASVAGRFERLVGVSLALDGDGDLAAEARRRCAVETQSALTDLRSALQRPLGRTPRSTQTTLFAEVERLAQLHPELGLRLESGDPSDVPAELEPLAQSVLSEAVRNAGKHAAPTWLSVRVAREPGTFVLSVANDGVTGSRRHAGMGLRLAALEALQSGGVVEFGEREPGIWQVRLVVPYDG
jgi:hypothetical protein